MNTIIVKLPNEFTCTELNYSAKMHANILNEGAYNPRKLGIHSTHGACGKRSSI